jgi:hypothetical protein
MNELIDNTNHVHPLCKDIGYCFVFQRYIEGITTCNYLCNGKLTDLMYHAMEHTKDPNLLMAIRNHFKEASK